MKLRTLLGAGLLAVLAGCTGGGGGVTGGTAGNGDHAWSRETMAWLKAHASSVTRETVDESIASLGEWSQPQLPDFTAAGGPEHLRESTRSLFAVTEVSTDLARNARIARLVAEARRAPGEILPKCRARYAAAMEKWPALYADLRVAWLAWTKGENKEFGVHRSTPAIDLERNATIAMTYVLAEAPERASLRTLLDGELAQTAIERKYEPAYMPTAPVPAALRVYALHRVFRGIGGEGLSVDGRRARDTYLSWAADNIAGVSTTRDLRRGKTFEQDPPAAETAPAMTVYPLAFRDGTLVYEGEWGDLTARGRQWKERLVEAVEAALR